jgi:hypothetical protein
MVRAMKKRTRLSLTVAALAFAGADVAHAQSHTSAAGGASTQVPAIAIPAPPVLLLLVRTTLVALNQANFTGNYTVLHALATPALQAKVSPVQLGIAFTELREKHLDLSPVLLISPQLTEAPELAPDGALRLAGVFKTAPEQISFATIFRPVGGVWRIEALSVQAVAVPAPHPPQPAATPSSWTPRVVPAPMRKR